MKNNRYKSSIYHKIIFTISLLILLLIGAMTVKHINNISDSSKLLMHTYEVNLELEHLYSHIKGSENSMRGYLISKDSLYLETYQTDIKNINTSFSILKNLTNDNPIQQQNLESLYQIINKRYDYTDSYSYFNNNFDVNKNNTFKKNFNESSLLLAEIRTKLNEMVAIEKNFLKERNYIYNNQIYLTPILILGILFITLLLTIFTYYKTTKEIEKVQAANIKLNKSQFLSYQAEILSEFGTWEWNLDNNIITYSDNLYRILGTEPQSFEAGQENFMKFVHPEDIEVVNSIFEKILADEDLPHSYFRIIRSDGETRIIRSFGKLYVDKLGNKTVLGVTGDVTDEHKKNEILEDRNQELEQRVKELNDFNQVASHDLQEPLRKIQTFISRINEKDKENMTDLGKEYLFRMERASNRMRMLINDLLQYSKANRSETNLEPTNLNEILSNSLLELSQNIEDKNAVVNYTKLPVINGIHFQMQQLFSNLLSNSLKYSKENNSPIIDINCTEIIAKTEAVLNDKSLKKYYKINFVDNGIGFEQEYAENIFLLFNRLHGKTEYQGTGVGLAICKKIVENHKGYIFAYSQPDQGATFTVYLPVPVLT